MAKQKDKKKKKNTVWEKYFLFCSILIIITCIVFYSYRLIHYYKIEHDIIKNDTTLFTIITTNNNKEKGLYQTEEDIYYYKGNNVNNYLYYSGRMWRIIGINKDSIKLITDDVQTSLVWGITDNYEESYINSWLNDNFLKGLNNYEYYLNKIDTCIDKIEENNYTCNDKLETQVSIISLMDYLNAGGSDSYLNNNTYFWTSNASLDNKVWYVFNEGGINNNSHNEQSYYSYGIRPVINLKSSTNNLKGIGTKDDPYIIEEDVISVGSYLNYNNYVFRVMEKNDIYLKVVMNDYLKNNEENVSLTYDNSVSKYHLANNISSYLNVNFYNNLDKTNLTECDFYIGSYGSLTNYNYKNVYNEQIKSSVGIASIGDLFINDYSSWLSNDIDNVRLVSYKSNIDGTIFADSVDNNNYVRPVICLKNNIKITSGNGRVDNPYTWEVINETNN